MLKVAQIGLGGVAERIHVPAIESLPQLEIAAACDPDPARREQGKRWGIAKVYPDSASLFSEQKPDIAVIATPPETHRSMCLQALAAGAHVFCEKPFVTSVAEADEVIEAAERAGRVAAVNNQYRHMEMYRATQERLARGDFGRLFLIQGWQQMYLPPSHEKARWRTELVRYILFEFGTHALDLLIFFFNSYPESIYVQMPHPDPSVVSDSVVIATLRFPNECVATLVLNRLSRAPERYFEMRLDCTEGSIRISLGGVARAAAEWTRNPGRLRTRFSFVRGGEARLEKQGRSRVIARERQSAFASATARNLQHFLKKIESSAGDVSGARHARELIKIVSAGYESAQSGLPVSLSRQP